jgi:uncharacterized iron-regulated membrane protein
MRGRLAFGINKRFAMFTVLTAIIGGLVMGLWSRRRRRALLVRVIASVQAGSGPDSHPGNKSMIDAVF